MFGKRLPIVALLVGIALWIPLTAGLGSASSDPAPDKAKKETVRNAAQNTPATNVQPAPSEAKPPPARRASHKIERAVGGLLGNWVQVEFMPGFTWLDLLLSLAMLLGAAVVARVLGYPIQARLIRVDEEHKTRTWIDIGLEALSKPLSLFVWIWGIYFAVCPLLALVQQTSGSDLPWNLARRGAEVAGLGAIVWFIYRLATVSEAEMQKWAESTKSKTDDLLVRLVGRTFRIFVVVVAGVMILQNLTGIKIGPLLASLGLGGLALALAAKDTLANLFGTFTILVDKPFQMGQRIVIEGFDGTVESVGYRSTRLRTLAGHMVSVPNHKIVNAILENVGRRPHIRWNTNITLTYDTTPEKMEQAVGILEEILKDHEGMADDYPPRVFFNSFNDWNLGIKVFAWYHPAEWWQYQAWVQKTCLEIMRQFDSAGIEFAFPSQTLYLANDDKRQLKLSLLRGSDLGPETGSMH